MKKFLALSILFIAACLYGQIQFLPAVNYSVLPYTATLQASGTIYYTTDGSVPTTSSPSGINSVTLQITQNIVVKALLKNPANQLLPVVSRPYYTGSIPQVTVYFKPPATWDATCSYFNYIQPEFAVDYFPPGNPMTVACNGWFKATYSFYKASVNFSNCFPFGSGPLYQATGIITEGTVFYDYSSGPVTNPPACLLSATEAETKMTMVKVIPNPVQDLLKIKTALQFNAYEVVDAQGKSVRKGLLISNEVLTADLLPGLYYLRLSGQNEKAVVLKFIKQ